MRIRSTFLKRHIGKSWVQLLSEHMTVQCRLLLQFEVTSDNASASGWCSPEVSFIVEAAFKPSFIHSFIHLFNISSIYF